MTVTSTFKHHSFIYAAGLISTCAFFVFLVYGKTEQVYVFRGPLFKEESLPKRNGLHAVLQLGNSQTSQPADYTQRVDAKPSPRGGKRQDVLRAGKKPSLHQTDYTQSVDAKPSPRRSKLQDVSRPGKKPSLHQTEKDVIPRKESWYKQDYGDAIKLPNISLSDLHPDFTAVRDLPYILYAHAALWQKENVRISVVKKLKAPINNTLCVLWYSPHQNAKPYFVEAIVKDLQSYRLEIACGYIKCVIKEGEGEKNKVPLFVSLVDGNNVASGLKITLPVENPIPEERSDGLSKKTKGGSTIERKNRMVEFTVCVPTMFNLRNAGMLVEKLEMIKIMGARRIVLYKQTVFGNVEKVLAMYAQEFDAGRETLEVIVHHWKPPPVRLHYRGQVAAVDDCLYRYKWTSRYMVFNDLDELIVPFHHANWSQLIAERERLKPDAAAFMFRSTVMAKDHSTPAEGFEAEAFRYHSEVLRVTERADFIWPILKRSKIIVKPWRVEAIGVHHVYQGYGPTDVVPPDQALLYHYRWPIGPSCEEVRDTRVADRYGQQLVQGLKRAWSKLKGVPHGWKAVNATTRVACLPGANKVPVKKINRRIKRKQPTQ